MMEIETTTSDYTKVPALRARGLALVEIAKRLVVTNQREADAAGEYVTGVDDLIDEIHKVLDPICAANNAAHKKSTTTRAEQLKEPEEGKRIAKEKIAAWMEKEKAAAQKAAAEEQARIQKQLDDLALEEAGQLEAAGMPEHAQALIESPPVAPPIPAVSPQVAGFATAQTWNYSILPEVPTPRLEDLEAALIDEAAHFIRGSANPGSDGLAERLTALAILMRKRMKRFYLVPNAGAIQSAVRAMKKSAEREVGGILVTQASNLRSARR